MKRYRAALILLGSGLVLAGGLALRPWGRVSSPESSRPAPLLPSNVEIDSSLNPSAPMPSPTAGIAADYPFPERFTAALGALEAEADPMGREEKLQALVDTIALSDIPAGLKLLQTDVQTDLQRQLQVRLIRHAAATNPPAAAVWAEQLPAGLTRSEALAGVAVVWANQDLAEAARWASQLPEGEDRQNALTSVAYEAARSEPVTALQLAGDLPANDARDELVRHAALQWAAQDPASAAAWVNEMANPALREQILVDLAAAWGETDPAAAARLALQSLSPGKPQEDAVMGIVQRWVQKEPEKAAAWVLEFPVGLFQQTALENLVKLWADRDAAQAERWIKNLPAGNQRDIAVGIFAGWLAPDSPADAAQWVEAFSSESTPPADGSRHDNTASE